MDGGSWGSLNSGSDLGWSGLEFELEAEGSTCGVDLGCELSAVSLPVEAVAGCLEEVEEELG